MTRKDHISHAAPIPDDSDSPSLITNLQHTRANSTTKHPPAYTSPIQNVDDDSDSPAMAPDSMHGSPLSTAFGVENETQSHVAMYGLDGKTAGKTQIVPVVTA